MNSSKIDRTSVNQLSFGNLRSNETTFSKSPIRGESIRRRTGCIERSKRTIRVGIAVVWSSNDEAADRSQVRA